MARYEANINGSIELGEIYSDFDEVQVLEDIFTDLDWSFSLVKKGRGGYLHYYIEDIGLNLHIYLKKITFGGRENRPKEKRTQFSAGLDRSGFEISQDENSQSVILGIYKREIFDEVVICAWSIDDWGYNVGRAFNCFVSIDTIADSFKIEFAQQKSSAGQIVCCFKKDWFNFYLKNKDELHDKILSEAELQNKKVIQYIKNDRANGIPKFDELFQSVIDSLKFFNGSATIFEMEEKVAELLNLDVETKNLIHSEDEGLRTELGYQLAWARNYLKRAGFITNPTRSVWKLTDSGWHQEISKNQIKKLANKNQVKKEVELDFYQETDLSESNAEIEFEEENTSVIDHPFDPNQVKIRTRVTSMDNILSRLKNNEIDLQTDFQRQSGLWDLTTQSRLIESVLIRFPLPAFYFDGSNDDCWLVVDGLQRLSTLHSFVNKREFKLKNLEFLTQFNNHRFDELPGNLKRRINEFEITAYVIEPGTPKYLKYIVFKRINTGGLILTSQEIRHALNQGVPAKFVKELANLRSFKQATSFSVKEDRMLDREFVTRFFAFYYFSLNEYIGDLDNFLNKAMEAFDKLSSEELVSVKENFDSSMKAAISIFGENAFRKKYFENDRRKPINKALFEVWSVSLSKLSAAEVRKLEANKEELNQSLMNLMNNDLEFHKSISSSTGGRLQVLKRFSTINKLIQEILIV